MWLHLNCAPLVEYTCAMGTASNTPGNLSAQAASRAGLTPRPEVPESQRHNRGCCLLSINQSMLHL